MTQTCPLAKLVADSVTAALEAQAATMANASNPNRNTRAYCELCIKNGETYKRVHRAVINAKRIKALLLLLDNSNSRRKNYTTHDLELGAVVFAFKI
ncbi:hypothetical protein Tco_0190844 [Tanacetum coccineum]